MNGFKKMIGADNKTALGAVSVPAELRATVLATLYESLFQTKSSSHFHDCCKYHQKRISAFVIWQGNSVLQSICTDWCKSFNPQDQITPATDSRHCILQGACRKIVVTHRCIVNAVLKDPGRKFSLHFRHLRVYHRFIPHDPIRSHGFPSDSTEP